MAYATRADVQKILPEGETVPEDAIPRLDTALEEATDLVISYLDREFDDTDEDEDGVPDDVPPAVRRVVARIAMRGFLDEPSNPGAVAEHQLMGPLSYTVNWSREAQARDFYLTDSDRDRLDRFKLFTATGAAHVPLAGAGADWWTSDA